MEFLEEEDYQYLVKKRVDRLKELVNRLATAETPHWDALSTHISGVAKEIKELSKKC